MTTHPKTHWAACQVFSKRGHLIRAEIEKSNHGTFLPTYAARWFVDGKLSCREKPLMPGYLFFMTRADDWSAVSSVDGVYRVLANGGRASLVHEAEMSRMVLEHAMGVHNKIELYPDPGKRPRQRRRRPRPGKRFRMRAG